MAKREPLTLDLTEVTGSNSNIVGVKAANLGELIRSNFAVPKGYAIKTAAYNTFIESNKIKDFIMRSLAKIDYSDYSSVEQCAGKIQERILECRLPSALTDEIGKLHSRLALRNVAVRSSATAEDLPTASFAGQYDSFLNVRDINQVVRSVKQCYASLWSSRAIAYRKKNNIPHDRVELGVVVQEMVPAKSAGVIFTQNPVSQQPNEFLIESNFGLGESIMSGRSNPDQFVVRKEGKPGSEKFSIIDKRIGRKGVAVKEKRRKGEGGTEYVELSEEENEASSLTNQEILNLSQVGREIERNFESPQDIEWAIDQNDKLHILQSRPITSLRKAAAEDDIVWSRGYADDYWNDPVTPLYFELLGDPLTKVVNMELNSIMGYKRMDDQLLKLYDAHAYFNLKVLKRKVENEIPTFVRNEDVLNYFPEGYGPYGKQTIKKLPFRIMRYLIANVRIMFHDPNGSMSKTAEAYQKWSDEVFTPYCAEFDKKLDRLAGTGNIKELQGLADDIDGQMVAHYRLVRYGIPVHNIGMNLMAQYILRRFLGQQEAKRLYPILISGLEHKLTETNNAIYHLASSVAKSPELKNAVLREKSQDLYAYLSRSADPSTKSFFNEFKNFLKDYGDRGFSRETYYPRWRESPQYVFDIIKSLVKDSRIDLEKSKELTSQNRERTEKLVETELRSQHLGFLKWFIYKGILGAARIYISFRENQRYNLDRWITRTRNTYLEIGESFAKKGVLDSKNDIFFLHKKEIKDLICGRYCSDEIRRLLTLVRERREDFLKHENTIPPKFLQGSSEYNDTRRFTKDSTEFRGLPASQGTVTARVRVLDTIEGIASVKKGEILVVPRTDPGWSPVFSKIGGLITETGGILSHGAVISREYGIPAVTNVPNACKMFETGQILTINGGDGTITQKR